MSHSAFHSTVILQLNGKAQGTGFLVHESGLLATCYHILSTCFKTKVDNIIGQILDFVTLTEIESPHSIVRHAQITHYHNEKNDIALLQIQGDLPAGLQVVKLIRSEYPLVTGTDFLLEGHAEVPDPNVRYEYFSASGQVVNTILRERVKVLQLHSPNLHRGMSGGAIYATHLGGVVGMQSRRLNLDPTKNSWGRDTGFACVSEAIANLAPDMIGLHDPTQMYSASSLSIQTINPQILQFSGNINAQAVMFADLGLTKSWSRPMEVSWPSQQSIPRWTELQFIREQLATTERDLTTGLALWGISGSGKSTIAEQYARQYSEDYPGGVLYIKLGTQFTPQKDLQPILTKWAEYGYGGNQQLAERLGKQRVDIAPQDVQQLFSGHGKMLAVLDDVYSGEHLNRLLEALPVGTDLLITTPSEQALAESAIIVQFREVQGLDPKDAITVLKGRLPQLNDDLLTQLADTFKYHAQALLLITAELRRNENPEAIIQQLLHQPDQEALALIRTAFEYSYQQLENEDDRQRFKQLGSLCPPPVDFGEDLAAALWDLETETALKFLQTLQERALVIQGRDQRWSMNSLIYNFARDLLQAEVESGIIDLTRSRYQRYAYQLAIDGDTWEIRHRELSHLQYVGNQLIDEFAAAYLLDFDNLETESDNTLSNDQRSEWEAISNYLISARSYLLQPEAQGLAKRWLKALIVIGQVLDEPAITALGSFLIGQWYLLYENNQQHEGAKRAIEMFDRANLLWRRVGNIQSVGYTLIIKGSTLRMQGEPQQALATFEMALREIEIVGEEDWQLRAMLLVSLSSQYLSINEYDQARQYLEQAAELCEDLPFTNLTVEIAQQFSVLSFNRGKPEESMERLQEVREQAVKIGNDRTVAEIDISIGYSHFYQGNGDAANQMFEAVLKQAEALTYPQLKPSVLTGLAEINAANGEFQQAYSLLKEALQILNRYQDKSQEAHVLANLGAVAFAMNEADEALEYLKRALPLLHTTQSTTIAVRALDIIGLIYQQTNRVSEGLTFLKEELPRIRELNNAGAEVTILNWLAQLLNNVGDISQAIAYFDEAEPIIAKIENLIERATIQTITASLYLFIGKTDKAADKAREVIDIWRKLNNRSKLSEALVMLAGIFFRQSKTDKVKKLLEEVNTLTQEGDQTYVRALYYNLCGVLELQSADVDPNRLDEAQQMFERSVTINESVQSPEIKIVNLINLGGVCFYKQDFEGAQKYCEESVKVAREQNSASYISNSLTNLGALAYLRGDTKEGIQYFEQAIALMEEAGITIDIGNQNIDALRLITQNISQEDTESLHEASIKMLMRVENWQNLRFVLEVRKESFWTDETDQILTATIKDAECRKQSSLVKVLSYYQSLLHRCREDKRIPIVEAMQYERESIAVEHWWASLKRQNRNYGSALTHINRVLEVDSMDVDALIERGWIHRGLGRLPEAIADFDTVLKLQKRDYRPYQGKGVVLIEWGNLKDAIAILTKAIDLGADDAYNYHWRATAYQLLEDFESALEDLNCAIKLAPQTSDHLYRRALLYIVNQKPTEARQELTKVIELDKENRSALAFDYFWRGVANDQLKDTEGAKLDWTKGKTYAKAGISLWSCPLFSSVANLDRVEDEYHTLLDSYFPWHILHAQIQTQKILERIYPNKICYSKVKKILEQKLKAKTSIANSRI